VSPLPLSRDKAVEFGSPVPKKPIFFLKPTTSYCGKGETIIIPNNYRVEHEGGKEIV
jgi:2-keto-4-pentenoate hydratase/2-oxohepta-3-ene-1,7-dioic acid hydratase in catechol pathway